MTLPLDGVRHTSMPPPEILSWSAPTATPAEIEAALRRLLRSCHDQAGACVPARVLNLVCVVEQGMAAAISDRLLSAGRHHASRTIICAVDAERRTVGATASLGTALSRSHGDFAVLRESVTLEVGDRHLPHLDTIVDPILARDLPTVLWCARGHDDAAHVLLALTDVILLDSTDVADAGTAIARIRELLRDVAVVDLAWLRSAPWRERIAAAFDPPRRRDELPLIRAVGIRHHALSRAAGLLLLGWLASRLGWTVDPLTAVGSELRGHARGPAGEIGLTLAPDRQQLVPGLAGVGLETRSGWRLALERGRGGLRAIERDARGRERRWTLAGASRGEPGILGEGIRQALLRDAAFDPAVRAAARLAAAR